MNKIITRPEEIVKNEQVLYAGNHYLSVPMGRKISDYIMTLPGV